MRRLTSTFDDLHKAHAKEVLTLAGALGVNDAEERQDVAQEVWLIVARHLARYEHRSPRVWLATITRNTVKTWRRTRRRRPEFSTPLDEGRELVEPRTPESVMAEEEQREAFYLWLVVAIPDEERREALVLQTTFGLEVAEVAETMGVSLEKMQARLQMARRDFEQARRALSDEEREKLRAYVLPFASVDEMMAELRSGVSDEEVELVRRRVLEQLALEGIETGGADNGVRGGADNGVPGGLSVGGAARYGVTGGQIAGGVGVAFVVGAIVGAGVLYALWSGGERERSPANLAPRAAIANSEARDARELPDVSAGQSSGTGSAEAAPSGSGGSSGVPALVASGGRGEGGAGSVDGGPESRSLLRRARQAVALSPRDALAILAEHERQFPDKDAAGREEIAVRALVQLGERGAAEARAGKLVGAVPSMRAPMEALLGRRFP